MPRPPSGSTAARAASGSAAARTPRPTRSVLLTVLTALVGIYA